MFAPDELDQRLAAAAVGRSRCQMCRQYFDLGEIVAGHSGICPSCVGTEGDLFQDNEPVDEDGYRAPREAPEVIVARIARIRAEESERRMMLALLQHHQFLIAIANTKGRGPLKVFPKQQADHAACALEMLEKNFPDIAARLESG